MSNYFTSAFNGFLIVALCAFLCENITSFSHGSNTLNRALGFICSLCIFLSIIFPIINAIYGVFCTYKKINIQQQEHKTDYSSYLDLVSQDMEKELLQNIYTNTGILLEDISINLTINDNSIIISDIFISHNFSDNESRDKTVCFLKELFGNDIKLNFTENKNENISKEYT